MANLASPHPTHLLFNGNIATQNPQQPMAQALAIGRGRILAVGSTDEILNLAGRETDKLDLDGRLVVPGFIDTHIHFYEWALKRQGIKFDDISDIEMFLNRLRNGVEGKPGGQWVFGQGWNETDWTQPCMPTRDLLDQAAPRNPVLLWRCDLHLAAANSAALEIAGINAQSSDPPEGRIERDERGEPTGILRELAINLVRDAISAPEMDQILGAFQDAAKALHRRGVTGIHDVRLMADSDGARAFQAFQKLDDEQNLALRSWITLPGDRLDDIIGLGLRTGFGNDRLRVGHVKFFSDGGMGARTAWMIDPFLDAGCGMPLVDMETLARDVQKADQAGLSVMVHAVGDRANRELIDLFGVLENNRNQSGQQRSLVPHRIEHVQMIRPEDVKRLSDSHLALCVTPANMILDINLIDAAVGEKGEYTYAFRSLIDTGAPVMFSSDCPVCDPDPLMGIHAAVSRQRSDGTPEKGWYPEQRVTVSESIQAYTSTPAKVHQALDLGVIAPGNRADFAILSENIFNVSPSAFPHLRVDMTVFDGKIVYREF